MNLGELTLEIAKAWTVLLPILLPGLFFILCLKQHWLERLNKPIDFGLSLGGRRVFGANKNWRGAVIYIYGGTAITALLHQLANSFNWVADIYQNNPYLLGPICTSAYVFGELVNSFIKRRLGIDPAKVAGSRLGRAVQAFFDNADGAIAYAVALQLLVKPTGIYLWVALVLAFLVHFSTDILMRKLALKKKK